jgi:hypothetical protein
MTLIERDGREGPTDAFLDLPRVIYRDDPMWIPEEPEAVASSFSAANPWFDTGAARLFCVPGRCRLAVFEGSATRVAGRPAAFFGYFESTGDPANDARAMRCAERWAAERGAETMYGPIDFSTFGRYRLRVSAEAHAMTFPGEPYNPPAYPRWLERQGYVARRWYVTQIGPPPLDRVRTKRQLLADLEAHGYRFEPLCADLWLARLEEIHRSVDAIFGDNFAYSSVPWDMFRAVCGESLAARLCPESSVIALDSEGDIAGFFLVLPQYGPLLVQGAGPGRLRGAELSRACHLAPLAAGGRPDAIAKTAGVMPAHRGKGLMDALAVSAVSRGAPLYHRWFGALIRADSRSRNFADGCTTAERRYALYAKALLREGAA